MPQCPPALLLVLLVATASGQGTQECQEQAVPTAGMLELRPERHHQEWEEVHWRVTRGAGPWTRILTARKDGRVSYTQGFFPGRAVFQLDTLSLRVSPVQKEDSGVYKIEFEDPSGVVTNLTFCVLVWDPVPRPELRAQTLHREQGWCNISVSCSVPAPGDVSYSWNCSGDPPGAPQHRQPQLLQRVPVGAAPTLCLCNVSNPVSWSTASADIVGVCGYSDLPHLILWPVVASAVGLMLFLVVTCCWWRKRKKTPAEAPPGHVEEPLTIYEEVGRDKTSQDPNGTFEATQAQNTVYAVVHPTAQTIPPRQEECRYHQQPRGSTIYSTVQLGRRPPSLRRKRLDPALVSTAYLEDMGGPRPWRPSLRTPHPTPASLHLS